MIEGANELPIVNSLYDIKEVGFYRYGEELVKQCPAVTHSEAIKEIYNLDGVRIGQTWTDGTGVMFRRNLTIVHDEYQWNEWFIVEKEDATKSN